MFLVATDSPAASDKDVELIRDALASLNPVERLLWGRSVRVGLSRPNSRISMFLPRYGIKGATYTVVGNIWLGPGIVAFFVSIAFWSSSRSTAESAAFWLCLGLVISSLLCATYRIITAALAIRQFRRAGGDASRATAA